MITNISLTACEKSNYVNLQRMHYTQNGVQKSWDVAMVHDSVAVLLYHEDNDAILLVKQFRPAVYLKNNDGYTYELCAGIVDKQLDLATIAKEEILEECGYDIPLDRLVRLTSFYTSVGFAGSLQTLYYATIDERYKISDGGGIDDESIELVWLPYDEIVSFIVDETKPKTPGLMYACQWFLTQGHLTNRY